MKNTIMVVEGKNDYERIKKIYPNLSILITNGRAIKDSFIEDLIKLSVNNDIVLFLDPDFPGERIRKQILEKIPNCKHIFIDKKYAISKNHKKVGVEHVDLGLLKKVMEDIKEPIYTTNITNNDVYELGLNGENESKYKREQLCKILNIGYANAKQLTKRLNMFGYTLEDIKKAMEKIK